MAELRLADVGHARKGRQASGTGRKRDGGRPGAATGSPEDCQPPEAGPRTEAGRCRAALNTVEVGSGSLPCRLEQHPAPPDRRVVTSTSGSNGEMQSAGGEGFDWREKVRRRSDLPPSATPSRGQPESVGQRRRVAEECGEPVEWAGPEEREFRSEPRRPVARSGHRGCWERVGRPERANHRPSRARTRERGTTRGTAPRSPIPSRLDGPTRWTEPG